MNLEKIKQAIVNDPENKQHIDMSWEPLYTADKQAKIVIVGQAPGRIAQETGVPWNDASGKNLRQWLGVSDKTFYDPKQFALIPMDFYFPGTGKSGDLPPRKDFAEKWHPVLFEQMQNVELVILVGQYAQKYYLGDSIKKNLTETIKSSEEYLPKYFPLVHPSPRNNIWQAKNRWFQEQTVPCLQKRVSKILE